MDRKNTSLAGVVAQVDHTIEPFFTKTLPQLPANIQEVIAKIAPFFVIISVVLSGLALIAALGLTLVALPFVSMYGGFYGAQSTVGSLLGIIFLIAQVALEGLAIPGLLKRQRSAWNLLFIASLVGALYNLLTFNLVSLVIGFLISFYLLYQIKHYYTH